MKIGYYQAETINGVTFFGEYLEDADVNVLSPRTFFESLDDLSDEETIFTFISEQDTGIYNEINDKFGIRS